MASGLVHSSFPEQRLPRAMSVVTARLASVGVTVGFKDLVTKRINRQRLLHCPVDHQVHRPEVFERLIQRPRHVIAIHGCSEGKKTVQLFESINLTLERYKNRRMFTFANASASSRVPRRSPARNRSLPSIVEK